MSPVQRMCKGCGRSIIVWSTAQTRCPKCQQARSKAKPPTPIKKVGKITKRWIKVKHVWREENPPDENGYWTCYLQIDPLCLRFLDESTITLDHVIGRGRDPSKRYDMDNLQPCCSPCNTLKGSQSLEEVRRKYGQQN